MKKYNLITALVYIILIQYSQQANQKDLQQVLNKDSCFQTESQEGGGWDQDPVFDFLLKALEFNDVYRMPSKFSPLASEKGSDIPLIWSGPYRGEVKDFIKRLDKQKLICEYGDMKVQLSNSITFSYDKSYLSFKEYIELMEQEKKQTLEEVLQMEAGQTWYNFGGNDWKFVNDYYKVPATGKNGENSPTFGIGRSGSGVPFHFHGQVYLELFYGQKIWFFAPPEIQPKFNPEEATFKWFYEGGHIQEGVSVVVQQPGEIVYIPEKQWHATLNIGETVFIATFA